MQIPYIHIYFSLQCETKTLRGYTLVHLTKNGEKMGQRLHMSSIFNFRLVKYWKCMLLSKKINKMAKLSQILLINYIFNILNINDLITNFSNLIRKKINNNFVYTHSWCFHKDLSLIPWAKRSSLSVTSIRTMPHLPRQIPAKIQVLWAQMRLLHHLDFRESGPPVVFSDHFQIYVANRWVHAWGRDAKLVHHASLEGFSGHIIKDLRLQRVYFSCVLGVQVANHYVIGLCISKS